MASEFQRTKLQDMFNAFDVNGDGCLEEADFAALTTRWSRLPRVRADGELAVRVEDVLLGWWQHLSEAVDTDDDGRIDMDDLLAMVDRLPAMRDAVAATADTVFDAVDENGDGRISRNEHQRLIDLWHGQRVVTGDVFDRLDQDADGHLSRSEFAALWTQFWISDDPAEPGNYVCGPVAGHSLR
ncbi:EF-hand domain-containing protein [Streptomyces sp. PU10]|uniref:EF-hand domain-containing protein n=1 Tax=unclassified Streptomyces TaxID=2593676 RepID=UPI0015928FBD|nr:MULTISPECIES: EF-hand domain-containing protein [unclassified Streptomyces]MDU0251825.1 EF-hand domain-containing protein [Streptomyces sp. PU10]QKW65388.1 EF-hand domain-containing protein [Streptomyces sp. NA03103]